MIGTKLNDALGLVTARVRLAGDPPEGGEVGLAVLVSPTHAVVPRTILDLTTRLIKESRRLPSAGVVGTAVRCGRVNVVPSIA